MKITVVRFALVLGMVLTVAIVITLLWLDDGPQTPRIGTALTDAGAAQAAPATRDSETTDPIATAPYSPPENSEPLVQATGQDQGVQPFVTLSKLNASTQKRIRHRIASSSLMLGLEEELQIKFLVTTPEKWEEIRDAITKADRAAAQELKQIHTLLTPILAQQIEEGRAEADDPNVIHRLRTQQGYAVRQIVAKSRGSESLSISTYALRYQSGTNHELDTHLDPVGRELARRSAELGNTIRAIIARE